MERKMYLIPEPAAFLSALLTGYLSIFIISFFIVCQSL
ncbi:Uncharacterized protein dnm_014370 [Desulfonema magnum]|uniref:Uncharacterized protein n=1 Tax=Desulfonema magnum TaxID=45655 RepID=A0A975BHJ1_9BACT|nr:Uncharacterized protein dnm_014370 [Desulfonema magnum]